MELTCIFFQLIMKTLLLISNNSCQPIEFTCNDELPKCWDLKQAKYFCEEYSWLCFKNKRLGCNICYKININLNQTGFNVTLFHLEIVYSNNKLV